MWRLCKVSVRVILLILDLLASHERCSILRAFLVEEAKIVKKVIKSQAAPRK
jgi:hypothetical protein